MSMEGMRSVNEHTDDGSRWSKMESSTLRVSQEGRPEEFDFAELMSAFARNLALKKKKNFATSLL